MEKTISKICTKRLVGDLKLLAKEPLENIETYPDDNDILTWYFLIKGPEDSPYKDGWYIGKILHNPEYPLKPPDFMMLTPNGRFSINKKICMTNTGYHTDSWSPMWSIKAILIGFLSIMLSDVDTGISHIKKSDEERQSFALSSHEFNTTNYGEIFCKFSRLFNNNINNNSEKDNSNENEPKKKKKRYIRKRKKIKN